MAHRCSKCGGETVKGFVAERSEQADYLARWIEGTPQHRKVLGMSLADVEVDGRRQFPVRSLRCDQCGFLELYAI